MYFHVTYTLLVLNVFFMFPACEKESGLIDPVNMENNKYYDAEIFPGDFRNIYGIWELRATSGGFDGGGYSSGFDLIEIQEIGIFKIYRNDSLINYGRINIENIGDENFLVFFEAENEPVDIAFFDVEKHVDLRSDTLNLFAPCCDRYNYHFIRSKKG